MNQTTKQTILVFGTFDLIHEGHLNFFKQARKLAKNPYLVVSIARDQNVKKIKGRAPQTSERSRRLRVAKIPQVDSAVLGGLKNHIPHIVKLNPQIIALGYDQKAYVQGLRHALAEVQVFPKILRLKPFKPHIYKTSLLRVKHGQKGENHLK